MQLVVTSHLGNYFSCLYLPARVPGRNRTKMWKTWARTSARTKTSPVATGLDVSTFCSVVLVTPSVSATSGDFLIFVTKMAGVNFVSVGKPSQHFIAFLFIFSFCLRVTKVVLCFACSCIFHSLHPYVVHHWYTDIFPGAISRSVYQF